MLSLTPNVSIADILGTADPSVDVLDEFFNVTLPIPLPQSNDLHAIVVAHLPEKHLGIVGLRQLIVNQIRIQVHRTYRGRKDKLSDEVKI